MTPMDLVPRSSIRVLRTPAQRYTTARIEVDLPGGVRVVALRFHRSRVDHPARTYFNRGRIGSPRWELYLVTNGFDETFERYATADEAASLDRAVADYDPACQLSRLEQFERAQRLARRSA